MPSAGVQSIVNVRDGDAAICSRSCQKKRGGGGGGEGGGERDRNRQLLSMNSMNL